MVGATIKNCLFNAAARAAQTREEGGTGTVAGVAGAAGGGRANSRQLHRMRMRSGRGLRIVITAADLEAVCEEESTMRKSLFSMSSAGQSMYQ
jgi:hypothetical protein